MIVSFEEEKKLTSWGWVGPSSSLVRVWFMKNIPGWNDDEKFDLDEQDKPIWTIDE